MEYELYHWGIKGMKWGIRRFQNKNGSLTAEGKKRYDGDSAGVSNKASSKKKSIKEMSDEELRTKLNRLSLESQVLSLDRQVASLTPQQTKKGQAFISKIGKEVVGPSILSAGKTQLTNFLNDRINKALGLNAKDPLADLKKSVDVLNLKKQKSELEKYFKNGGKDQTSESDMLAKLARDLENKGKIAKNADYADIEDILNKILEKKT